MCASLCGGGVSVKGGLCPGGLCQDTVSVKRGSLSGGSLSRGCLSRERPLSRGSLSRGRSLSMGVSVRETPPYSKERTVRILLEYILVVHMFSEHMVDKITGITRQVQRCLTPRSRWRYTGVRGPLSFFTAR